MLTAVRTFAIALCLGLLASPASAHEAPKNKQTKLGLYLTPAEVSSLVKAERSKVLFLDIRTRAELQFVGYTEEVDAVVPYFEMADWDDRSTHFMLERPKPPLKVEILRKLSVLLGEPSM